MKATHHLFKWLGEMAGFVNGFWTGFFEEPRGYARWYDTERAYAIPLRKHNRGPCPGTWQTEGAEGNPEESRHPSSGGGDGSIVHAFSAYYRRLREEKLSQPPPPPPPKPPAPPKVHRPDREIIHDIDLDAELRFPVRTTHTFIFRIVQKPYMERHLHERLYSYRFLVNGIPGRFCIGTKGELFRHRHEPGPMPVFLLTTVSERVEYLNGIRRFVIVYTIGDANRKKRTFRAVQPEKEGVVEALKFLCSLQYYRTWQEYDEMKEICPVLRMTAQEVRDQLRWELCELGLKLRRR